MANERLRATESFLAEGAVIQYRAVQGGTAEDQVKAVDGATNEAFGVLQNDPPAGGEATVELMEGAGETKWEAGGTITIHQLVGLDSVGRCVVVSGANAHVYGMARTAATIGILVRVALQNRVLHA